MMGPRRNPSGTKLRSAGKDAESKQMAACHLTNEQNHSLNCLRKHFLTSSSLSCCLLSSIQLRPFKLQDPFSSGEQLGKQPKQKKKNQTRTSPNDSQILEATARSNTLGITPKKILFYRNIPCPQIGLQLKTISIANFINSGHHSPGKDLLFFL